jgi:hypothetical protein
MPPALTLLYVAMRENFFYLLTCKTFQVIALKFT